MANWNGVLNEIQRIQILHTQAAQGAVDLVRRNYLKKLSEHTNRCVIAYYSGFLSKPKIEESSISDEDKNGFMMALNGLTKEDIDKGLDLVLHTQGGSLAATESIVDYLRRKFGRKHQGNRSSDCHVRRHDDRVFVEANPDGATFQPWAD